MGRTMSKAGCEKCYERTINICGASWSKRRMRGTKRGSKEAMSYTDVVTRNASSNNQLNY